MSIFTSLFVGLVIIVWLRLFIIFILVALDIKRSRAKEIRAPVKKWLDEVTVLIPAYQEEKMLSTTLDSAKKLLLGGASLVLVDDGSTDHTTILLNKFIEENGGGLLIRHEKNQGKANALNSGLDAIETPFVLTLDADTSIESEAVIAATALLAQKSKESGAAVVAFDISVKPSQHLFRELQGLEYDGSLNFERRGQSVVSAVSVAPGAASLWHTQALKEIDGFSNATVTEDVDATLKLAAMGKRAIHCPQAQAFTGTPMTFAQLMVQRRRWCLGHYQGIAHHISSLGKDTIFTFLTYPNFFLLSAFMPLMLFLSLITFFSEIGVWKSMLGPLTLFWIITVYFQRWVALKLAKRETTLIPFLLEPFSTLFFHICAMTLASAALIKKSTDFNKDVWRGRVR